MMIAETVVSFGAILFITVSVVPLLFTMAANLDEGKKVMNAHRFLYEEIERWGGTESGTRQVRHSGSISYELTVFEEEGMWKACAGYEGKILCLPVVEE